jgi:uncharacterized membrane protein (DUF2068 family)
MSAPATRVRVAPWEDFVLRLIAIYKLFHAAVFIAVGFGLLRLRHHNPVEVLRKGIEFIDTYVSHYHLNPENRFVDWLLASAGSLTSHQFAFFGYTAFFYAALFAAEGIGLYLRKHWAEYLVIIVTGSLLPFELYALSLKLALWKFVAVAGNLAILAYLVHRLRLDFHNRWPSTGGGKAPPSPTGTPSGTSRRVPTEVP